MSPSHILPQAPDSVASPVLVPQCILLCGAAPLHERSGVARARCESGSLEEELCQRLGDATKFWHKLWAGRSRVHSRTLCARVAECTVHTSPMCLVDWKGCPLSSHPIRNGSASPVVTRYADRHTSRCAVLLSWRSQTICHDVYAGPEGAVAVVCDASTETRGRRQFHASEVVLSHLKDATGSHSLSAAQRATLGVNSAYFSQQGSMASRV